MNVLRGANLALRFFLELAALVAVAYWGWTSRDGAVGVVLAIAAVAVLAAIWGLFVAPKRKVDLPRPARFGIEVGFWAAAGAALAANGRTALGTAFVGVAVGSGALNWAWTDPQPRPARPGLRD